uniref:Protein kinase domain-containing protein n=1 Tax=Oryza punctata TaxID=4537 RepID=A0A0E0KGQ8_ORYPU
MASSSSSSVIFLGTGCSGALPDARCLIHPSTPPCPVCSQALSLPPDRNPNYRCNTSLLIDYCQHDGIHKYILIDVGKTFREQVLRWFSHHKIPYVDSIILTHEHADAVLGLDDVWVVQPSSCRNGLGKVPIFLTQFTMDSVAARFPYLMKNKLEEGFEGSQVIQLDWRIIEGDIDKPFVSSGLEFVPLPVMHGEDYVCLGFLFGRKARIAYLSDVSRILPRTEHAISKSGAGQLDLLILETNMLNGEGDAGSCHLTLSQTLNAVKRISPKRALLIGMNHEFEHHKENQTLAEWSSREGIPVQLAHDGLPIMLFLLVFLVTVTTTLSSGVSSAAGRAVSLPGCPDKCGNVSIPYPFGVGDRCAAVGLNLYFNITCDDTVRPPVPKLGDPGMQAEILDITLDRGEIRLTGFLSYACYTSSNSSYTSRPGGFIVGGTQLRVSPSRNQLTVIGCNALGLMGGAHVDRPDGGDEYATGCYSHCASLNGTDPDGSPCAGSGCCQIPISPDLAYVGATFPRNWSNTAWRFNPCFYAVIAETGWYSFRRRHLAGVLGFVNETKPSDIPVVLDWAVRDGWCPETAEEKARRKYACVSDNSHCVNSSNGMGYSCSCSQGYEGNPYLDNGCQDIDECALRRQGRQYEDIYPCKHGICINTPGSYRCKCKAGTKPDGTNFGCQQVLPMAAKVIIGLSACSIFVMALSCLLVIQIQRRKHIIEKQEYFRRNGGLRLYDEMMSRQVDTVRVLTVDEIKKATDNFSDGRVLGRGGHGTVYRGTLDDLREVAIKRSKAAVDDGGDGGGGGCKEEFVNEIIVLSQINHRHVVRLLGCCLEVHVPMLVYEFVPNGTLFELLHGSDGAPGRRGTRAPVSLGLRLRIAAQSAEALAYLHSSASRAILHGDVKSLNILLDGALDAKVADFGASALRSMGEGEFIEFVQGTLGYLDPESFVNRELTDKSDVYSFGVVLVELITRKKAVYDDDDGEKRSLSSTFLAASSRGELWRVVDRDIMDEDDGAVVREVARLAEECLGARGEERPAMKEVAERLQVVRRVEMQVGGRKSSTAGDEVVDGLYLHGHLGTTTSSYYQSMETDKLQLDVDLLPAAGDADPPPSSSLIFLGTGCSTVVPDTRCLIRPSSTPPCPVCSQALSLPPDKNPNYRCNTSPLIDYCDDDGTHKYIIIDVGKTFREQVLRWFVHHKIPWVNSAQFLGTTINQASSLIWKAELLTLSIVAARFPYLVKHKLQEGDEPSQIAQLDWRIIEGDIEKPFVSSGLEFVPLPVMHGEGYICLGFLFGRKARIAYLSDISRFLPETEYSRILLSSIMPPFHAAISKSGAGQLDLLILEANSLHGEALDAVKRISPKRALLTGMAHELEYYKENQKLAEWSSRYAWTDIS